MAIQEEHIIDMHLMVKITVCPSISNSANFVAGASVSTHGARMFTPQMIVGSTQKEGTYHFFETKETALSLMVPNMGSKGTVNKHLANTFDYARLK
jgi:hypothetical protein